MSGFRVQGSGGSQDVCGLQGGGRIMVTESCVVRGSGGHGLTRIEHGFLGWFVMARTGQILYVCTGCDYTDMGIEIKGKIEHPRLREASRGGVLVWNEGKRKDLKRGRKCRSSDVTAELASRQGCCLDGAKEDPEVIVQDAAPTSRPPAPSSPILQDSQQFGKTPFSPSKPLQP